MNDKQADQLTTLHQEFSYLSTLPQQNQDLEKVARLARRNTERIENRYSDKIDLGNFTDPSPDIQREIDFFNDRKRYLINTALQAIFYPNYIPPSNTPRSPPR
jgi:hypothetical protein